MSSKRTLTAEDLHRMHWISDPVISSSDGTIAYILKSVAEKHDGYRSHIRVIHPDGTSIPFTTGEQDSSPAWSPDGSKLAFLRKKGDHRQVWIIPAHGGEASSITDFKHGIGSFKWSPDGQSLLIKATVSNEKDLKAVQDQSEKSPLPEAIVIDRMKYKADGGGMWDGRRPHLSVFSLNTKESVQITSGEFDVSAFAWSPDGEYVTYTATPHANDYPDPDLLLTDDLFVVNRNGDHRRQLSTGKLTIGSITYTPDGQSILALADDLSCGFATLTRIYLFPIDGGDARIIHDELDVQLGHSCVSDMRSSAGTAPTFSSDGQSVYIQFSKDGNVSIGQFALDGSEHRTIVDGDREIYHFAVTPEGNFVIAAADMLHPGDLFTYNTTTREEARLTNCNATLWDEIELSNPEMFQLNASDGWPIQGWIMKPIGFQDGSKVPAILEIHGGPQAMYGNTFMQEFQLLAAAGYAVFYTNPRGGHGYGQKHVNTVRGDYGGRDYQDLMDATDYVLSTYSYIDESRLGVTGGSYGGFMTNWIVGHTNRFQAAVTQRSISNWVSFYGVSDIGYYFTEDQIWGNPWNDLDKLWKHSPLAYVEQVDTPLLILHSEQDLRCPIEQGEQLFIALKRLGKEAQFIRFPGSDHNLSRSGHPHLRVNRLSHIVRWFQEHIEL